MTLDMSARPGAARSAEAGRRRRRDDRELPAGVLEGWGLGPDELHAVNPRLVLLRTTGFGQDGPYARRRAFGSLAEAMTGFAHLTGQPDGPPTLPPFGLADGVAGVTGAFAVMTALHARDHGDGRGQGQVIDLSLFEPLLGLMGPTPSAQTSSVSSPSRQGNRSRNSAPRNTYRTRDGPGWRCPAGRRRWPRGCCAWSGARTWSSSRGSPPRASGSRASTSSTARCSTGSPPATSTPSSRPSRRWARRCSPCTTSPSCSPIRVQARDAVTTVDDEDLGPLRMQNVWFRLSRTPGGIRFAGRRLGEDTDAVLTDRLGYTPEQVAALRKDGWCDDSDQQQGQPQLPLRARPQRQAAAPGVHRGRGRGDPRPRGRRAGGRQGPRAGDGRRGDQGARRTGAGQPAAHGRCAADLDVVAPYAAAIRIPKCESADDVLWVAAGPAGCRSCRDRDGPRRARRAGIACVPASRT